MVRTPKIDEFHKVLELVGRYALETGERMEDFNVPFFRRLLREGQKPDSEVYGAVVEDGDEFVGLIVGLIGSSWFSLKKIAMIGTIYVRPDYRGGPTAIKLLRGFEKWAKNHHVTSMRFEADTQITPERTYGFIERLGYTEAGRIFEKEI